MVQKVTPTVYLYNSTHNLYAVLVQRTGSAGVKYFFVSANAQAGILPPPYAHRYGSEWDTAAQAQSNIPSGFAVVPAPESCNMSIAVAVAIFEGINISVFSSPAGATSWTLQVSTNGTTFTTAKTVSSLLPNNSTGSGGNPTADGEIYYQVATSGLYYFRVLSSPCTSNVISQNLTVFSGGGGGGGETGGEVSTSFTTVQTEQFDFGLGDPFVYLYDSWALQGRPRTQAQNQTALQGFDYMAITGQFNTVTEGGITKPVLQNWFQKITTLSSSVNNIVQEGNQTYYFRPLGYTTNHAYNMFDFHQRFPEFTLPAGKIVAIQPVPFSTTEQAQMLLRGVTHVRNGVPDVNKVYFLNDDWLSNIQDVNGNTLFLPQAYQGTEAQRQNFYELLNPYQMAQQLFDTLVLRGRLNNGYIFWNYERVITWDDRIGTWGAVQPAAGDVGKSKRQIFFERFNFLKPDSTKFVAWTKKPVQITPNWKEQNMGAAWNAVVNGTATNLQQLDSIYVSNSLTPRTFPNGVSGIAAMDIYHTGFYQVGHRIYIDFLYKHVFETFINKKMASPTKKVIGTLWIDNETLLENDVSVRNVDVTYQGETLSIQMKPVAAMSFMQSFAAWMFSIGDGFDIWEYREFLEDKPTWDRLKNPANAFTPPHFPYSSLKGVDWAMSAVYSLSLNKDILESPTEWQFPVNPWTAANNQSPLVAWKLNSSGTAALVLAMNAYNDDMGIKTVSVIIGGVARTIKIHGKFTSIVRIVL